MRWHAHLGRVIQKNGKLRVCRRHRRHRRIDRYHTMTIYIYTAVTRHRIRRLVKQHDVFPIRLNRPSYERRTHTRKLAVERYN